MTLNHELLAKVRNLPFDRLRVNRFRLKLFSFHPETPSPLAGEGWGEGDENRKHKYSGPLSPPP
jgi:hypothetical protein